MAQGIYLIENKINNKKYVGQSVNIESRWKQHKDSLYRFNHLKSSPYLYNSIFKYGLDNFNFSILEEVEKTIDLNEREAYWILHLNTLTPNGYNACLPSQFAQGENNANSHLTQKEVDEIKGLLKKSSLTIFQIADRYSIHYCQIYRINRGESWIDSNTSYPIRKTNNEGRPGSQNGRSKLTEDEVLKIRQRYVLEDVKTIYEDYKDLYSLSGFKKVVQGTTFKNVPIYSKTTKKWLEPYN